MFRDRLRRAAPCMLLTALVLLGLILIAGCPAKSPSSDTASVASPSEPVAAKGPAAASGPDSAGRRITIFAGAASKQALQPLASAYEDQTGTKVDITFGGSGAVLTQFSQEQYGDVYIPGSDDFMEKAEQKDAVLKETRTILAYLVPVICVPKGNPRGIKGLDDLAQEGLRVVTGDLRAVCLGDIAQQMLQAEGLWEKVEPRIVSFASNCEDVLNTLLLGEADAVIGWDAWPRQYPEKVEGIALPPEIARPRNIPAAVIKWSKQTDSAKQFIGFLASDQARKVFEESGYTVSQ